MSTCGVLGKATAAVVVEVIDLPAVGDGVAIDAGRWWVTRLCLGPAPGFTQAIEAHVIDRAWVAVVTAPLGGFVLASIFVITQVGRARVAVVAIKPRFGHTDPCSAGALVRAARLCGDARGAVEELRGVIGAGAIVWVTEVGRARVAVITAQRVARDALLVFIAGLPACARVVVITGGSARQRDPDTALTWDAGGRALAGALDALNEIAAYAGSKLAVVVHCALVTIVTLPGQQEGVDDLALLALVLSAGVVVIEVEWWAQDALPGDAAITGGAVVGRVVAREAVGGVVVAAHHGVAVTAADVQGAAVVVIAGLRAPDTLEPIVCAVWIALGITGQARICQGAAV